LGDQAGNLETPAVERTIPKSNNDYLVINSSGQSVTRSQREKWSHIHQTSNWYEAQHGGWKLPGTSPRTLKKRMRNNKWEEYSDCGEWVRYGCLNLSNHPGGRAYVRTHQVTCFKASCEVCWDKWVSREAHRGTHKLETYGSIRRKPAKHIVISIPVKDWYMPFEKMKEKARELLKTNNIEGGCLIFHPFRHEDLTVLSNGADGIEDKKFWYWSPHFHIIGFGWIQSKTVEDGYAQTEWVLRNLGVRDSIHATLWYQLSHAGLEIPGVKGKHHHTITWFGNLSNTMIAKCYRACKPEKSEAYNMCPICQCRLKRISHHLPGQRLKPPWWKESFEGWSDPQGLCYREEREDERMLPLKKSEW